MGQKIEGGETDIRLPIQDGRASIREVDNVRARQHRQRYSRGFNAAHRPSKMVDEMP